MLDEDNIVTSKSIQSGNFCEFQVPKINNCKIQGKPPIPPIHRAKISGQQSIIYHSFDKRRRKSEDYNSGGYENCIRKEGLDDWFRNNRVTMDDNEWPTINEYR